MRRLLTWIALLLLVGGTFAAAAKSVSSDLASSRPFGREELGMWLAAVRSDESTAVVRRAARQLDRDFHAGHDWQPLFEQLPPPRQAQFAGRFNDLLALLIRQRADAYRAEPRHRRERFLDTQLRQFSEWYVVAPGGKVGGPALFQQAVTMMNSSRDERRTPPQVREFVAALQQHLLKRTLDRILPAADGDEK